MYGDSETLSSAKNRASGGGRACFSTSEAARFLGMSLSTVHRLLYEGQLCGFKPRGKSGHWRIRACELERFVERREREAYQEIAVRTIQRVK